MTVAVLSHTELVSSGVNDYQIKFAHLMRIIGHYLDKGIASLIPREPRSVVFRAAQR